MTESLNSFQSHSIVSTKLLHVEKENSHVSKIEISSSLFSAVPRISNFDNVNLRQFSCCNKSLSPGDSYKSFAGIVKKTPEKSLTLDESKGEKEKTKLISSEIDDSSKKFDLSQRRKLTDSQCQVLKTKQEVETALEWIKQNKIKPLEDLPIYVFQGFSENRIGLLAWLYYNYPYFELNVNGVNLINHFFKIFFSCKDSYKLDNLYLFFNSMFENINTCANRFVDHIIGNGHKRIIVIGISTGAVIVREACRILKQERKEDVEIVQLFSLCGPQAGTPKADQSFCLNKVYPWYKSQAYDLRTDSKVLSQLNKYDDFELKVSAKYYSIKLDSTVPKKYAVPNVNCEQTQVENDSKLLEILNYHHGNCVSNLRIQLSYLLSINQLYKKQTLSDSNLQQSRKDQDLKSSKFTAQQIKSFTRQTKINFYSGDFFIKLLLVAFLSIICLRNKEFILDLVQLDFSVFP